MTFSSKLRFEINKKIEFRNSAKFKCVGKYKQFLPDTDNQILITGYYFLTETRVESCILINQLIRNNYHRADTFPHDTNFRDLDSWFRCY